jgi:hypothetical protein
MTFQLSKFVRVSIAVVVVVIILLVAKVFSLEHRVSALERSLTPHVATVK